MSLETAREYLDKFGKGNDIMVFDVSSSTVSDAAKAVGTEEARIAKTLSFLVDGSPIVIVTSGDAKVDNKKYKSYFSCKAKMIGFDEVEELVGHAVGGVCPFAIRDNVKTYLDESLKRFDISYAAAGGPNTAIDLSCDELERYSQNFVEWIDVTKIPE